MADIEQNKLDVVYEYLRHEFPNCSITDKESFDYIGQSFTIRSNKELYLLTIQEAFFKDRSIEKISSWLKGSELSKRLAGKPNLRFLVNYKGAISVRKVV